jgi:hypothetical protein
MACLLERSFPVECRWWKQDESIPTCASKNVICSVRGDPKVENAITEQDTICKAFPIESGLICLVERGNAAHVMMKPKTTVENSGLMREGTEQVIRKERA